MQPTLMNVLGQFMRANYQCLHEKLAPLGIYPGQPPILYCLYHHQSMSQSQLARLMHVKPSTLTIMLKRMEHAGLVIRHMDAQDSRVMNVSLTAKAEKLKLEMDEVFIRMEQQCFTDFSEAEKQQCLMYMQRMIKNFKEEV